MKGPFLHSEFSLLAEEKEKEKTTVKSLPYKGESREFLGRMSKERWGTIAETAGKRLSPRENPADTGCD